MTKPQFFIDTADISYIESTWEKLYAVGVDPKSFLGITTNPNALSKVNCHTLNDLEILIGELTNLTSKIRGDFYGMVYVQVPNSNLIDAELERWCDWLDELDVNCNVGLKIPPYKHVLDLVTRLDVDSSFDLNVTGVSDAATALRCLSYPSVKCVSIIPGRMEEVGIDATKHLNVVAQRNNVLDQYVIAGSMRTVDGLKKSILGNTIPTIGARVFDSMTPNDYVEFNNFWQPIEIGGDYLSDIAMVDDRNVKLTADFFEQMDLLGQPLYEDFKRVCL